MSHVGNLSGSLWALWPLRRCRPSLESVVATGMDVPFLSSSAISREHYSLVQSVEAASTLQEVDDILVHKVDMVRRRFANKRQLAVVSWTRLLVLTTAI